MNNPNCGTASMTPLDGGSVMSDAIGKIVTDVAIISTKFDVHEKLDETRFAYIAEAFKDIRADLKKQNWQLSLIVGGLIALSRVPDLLEFLHK
jgi:hypothetical protein